MQTLTTPGEKADNRTAAQLYRQWAVLQQTKKQLISAGLLNGDATPQQVLQTLREVLPVDMLA